MNINKVVENIKEKLDNITTFEELTIVKNAEKYANDLKKAEEAVISAEEKDIKETQENLEVIKKKPNKSKGINLLKLREINTKLFQNGPNIEYVNPDKKEILIRYLIKNKLSETLDEEEDKMFKNCYNILYTNDHVYYKDPMYDGDNSLFGYKIINDGKLKYYKIIDGGEFIEVSLNEKKLIDKSLRKKIDENNETRPPANLCGYLEHKMPQNDILFKIRDKGTEGGKKGTQIKTGSVCNNDGMKKNKVISFIQAINKELIKYEKKIKSSDIPSNDDNYKDYEKINIPGKDFLCTEFEFYLRYLDIIDTTNRYYYNSEETIEYKLNEK